MRVVRRPPGYISVSARGTGTTMSQPPNQSAPHETDVAAAADRASVTLDTNAPRDTAAPSSLSRETSPASAPSSSSSFVPVDPQKDAIQLINEEKIFNRNVLNYIRANNNAELHRIIAVFGSQSTGKSTLLNNLFNTNFGVMDEQNRQQTTKGIWLAQSPAVNSNKKPAHSARSDPSASEILVMDVEGTDGRERGEDQDFERKAALFALATSEVLIVNIWETQVGLYQGANMGLLKTVFEVNLSLFGKYKTSLDSQRPSDHKVLLLFVIRDHLGVTSMDSLATTITQDLLKIWDALSKPPECELLAFSDFFDLAFHTLSHKVLQNEKFLDDIRRLGDRFVDPSSRDYLFKPYYHHDIPIEGWTMYAENCWDQIDSNKDLDLPTQQILVAKFKCDEIAAACYEDFLVGFATILEASIQEIAQESLLQVHQDVTGYKEIGGVLIQARENVLHSFDNLASRYNQSVFEQRRQLLAEKVNLKLQEVVALYAKQMLQIATSLLSVGLSKKPKSSTFGQHSKTVVDEVTEKFAQALAYLSLSGQINTNEYSESLETEIAKLLLKQQLVELNAIVAKYAKKLNITLVAKINEQTSNPSTEMWDEVFATFKEYRQQFLSSYPTVEGVPDFGVDAPLKTYQNTLNVLNYKSWEVFGSVVHKYLSKDSILNILKERFDEKFRYDENGLPRLYQNAKDLDVSYAESKEYAMSAFPILSSARLSNGEEIEPEHGPNDKQSRKRFTSVEHEVVEESDYSDSDEEEAPRKFADILTAAEKSEVMAKFKKEADAKYVETKRSIIQHVTQIPYYIYLVILVLGWNEFMAILRNPFFFTMLVVLGAGTYIMYQMKLLGPAIIVAQRAFDESLTVGKQKLLELLEPQAQAKGPEIEMQDMPARD